jgi:Mg-chelatase subunit ChlD
MILNLFVYIPAMASDTRSISGYIWYDANGNGKWESGNKHEYVIPNVSVQLYNANGNKIIKETTSDSSGYYCFSELSKSSYYKVKVILPSGYDFTELGKGNGNGVEDRLTKIDPETGFTEAIQPDNANINVGLIRGSSTSGTGGDSTKEDLLDVSRSVGTERLKKGDTFDAKYTITPKAIPAQKDNGEKDIVLVIDTSISMNYIPTQNRYPYYYNEKSRLQIIKEVANEFVNRFENNSKVNIGLVYYNKVAKTKVTLLNMGNDSSQYVLNSSINALKTDSNTNIGDGLRAAYYMLNEDNGHEKYIILMTDGYANTYSIDSHGNYYMGSSSNYWYDCNGNTDSKGLEYAKKVASEKIAPSGIKSFIVGFSSEANASNKQIAEAAGGNYQQAVSETAVTNVYNQIQKKIESTIYGTASFQETFNENLEVVNTGTLPSGLNVSGNKVIGSFNIEYNLNSSKTEFSAKPVSFTVRYRVKDNSVSVLGSGGNSSFGKITVANNTQIKYLEEKSIDTILQNGEYMDISRNISDESVNVGDTFSAEYNITPKPLPVTKDNTEKDIVLVIDTSGSMDEKVDRIRKIETMKKVAKNFIDKFKESKNFNIGLVEYSSYACKVSDILPASSNSEILKNKIDSLEIGGATNIGDGIRTAKAMLDERTSVKEKYIILMTDGEATAYSRDKNGNKKEETQYWWKYEYYKYYKYLDDYFGTTINSSIDHGAASGGDTYDGDTYITYNGVQNTTDANALSYAKNVVDNMIKSDDSVKQFIVVGLGSDASSSNAEIVK